MKSEKEIIKLLDSFGREIIKDVAVQTHTDWVKYYKPILEKYIKLL